MTGVIFVFMNATLGSDQMTTSDSLFHKVEKLASDRPFDRAKLEALFDIELYPSLTTQTQYFTIFKTDKEHMRGSGDIDAVELRIPTVESDKKDGLVILTVSPDHCIERQEVADWMGQPGELDPPRASLPASVPSYVRHQRDWGTVSFGFSREKSSCLQSIVLDATQSS